MALPEALDSDMSTNKSIEFHPSVRYRKDKERNDMASCLPSSPSYCHLQ